MTVVFADTSYYIAIVHEADAFHEAALRATEQHRGRFVTSEYVLLELGNALSRLSMRGRCAEYLHVLLSDPDTVVHRGNETLLNEGLNLFGNRDDKEWSLTDCTSFILMNRDGLSEALTSDHHFEQAGFRALLR